jgi:diguanylate cyclase (GGDEF)-like protein
MLERQATDSAAETGQETGKVKAELPLPPAPLAAQVARISGERAAGGADGTEARDRYFSNRVRQLAHLDLSEADAEELWAKVVQHRRTLQQQLGRDVGQRVALLDFISNMRPQIIDEPQIIEKSTLEAIEHRAVADALTGLFNRHYFETELSREAQRCSRYGVCSSLLLMDLDFFKEVNDTHGHRVGDHVLQSMGALILKHVRAADVPCRYGGDEFAVILPDTPLADALTVSQRICSDVGLHFSQNKVCGVQLSMTSSGGVATLKTDSTADQLFRAADGALYEAKRSGGGKIIAA